MHPDYTPEKMEQALKRWQQIGEADAQHLLAKEASYQGSWKKRGGIGAFMMLARKWDRLENYAEGESYDIFSRNIDHHALMEELGDLRRYLILVEDHLRVRLLRELAADVSSDSPVSMSNYPDQQVAEVVGAEPGSTYINPDEDPRHAIAGIPSLPEHIMSEFRGIEEPAQWVFCCKDCDAIHVALDADGWKYLQHDTTCPHFKDELSDASVG